MPKMILGKKVDEAKWAKAKTLADKEGHGNDYAYIMGIYKKMTGIAKSMEILEKKRGEKVPIGTRRIWIVGKRKMWFKKAANGKWEYDGMVSDAEYSRHLEEQKKRKSGERAKERTKKKAEEVKKKDTLNDDYKPSDAEIDAMPKLQQLYWKDSDDSKKELADLCGILCADDESEKYVRDNIGKIFELDTEQKDVMEDISGLYPFGLKPDFVNDPVFMEDTARNLKEFRKSIENGSYDSQLEDYFKKLSVHYTEHELHHVFKPDIIKYLKDMEESFEHNANDEIVLGKIQAYLRGAGSASVVGEIYNGLGYCLINKDREPNNQIYDDLSISENIFNGKVSSSFLNFISDGFESKTQYLMAALLNDEYRSIYFKYLRAFVPYVKYSLDESSKKLGSRSRFFSSDDVEKDFNNIEVFISEVERLVSENKKLNAMANSIGSYRATELAVDNDIKNVIMEYEGASLSGDHIVFKYPYFLNSSSNRFYGVRISDTRFYGVRISEETLKSGAEANVNYNLNWKELYKNYSEIRKDKSYKKYLDGFHGEDTTVGPDSVRNDYLVRLKNKAKIFGETRLKDTDKKVYNDLSGFYNSLSKPLQSVFKMLYDDPDNLTTNNRNVFTKDKFIAGFENAIKSESKVSRAFSYHEHRFTGTRGRSARRGYPPSVNRNYMNLLLSNSSNYLKEVVSQKFFSQEYKCLNLTADSGTKYITDIISNNVASAIGANWQLLKLMKKSKVRPDWTFGKNKPFSNTSPVSKTLLDHSNGMSSRFYSYMSKDQYANNINDMRITAEAELLGLKSKGKSKGNPKIMLKARPNGVQEFKDKLTKDWTHSGGFDPSRAKIINVFDVMYHNYFKDYKDRETTKGNVQYMYHGTDFKAAQNIIKEGYIVPPNAKAGRLLGNGTYVAKSASKAVQYLSQQFSRSGHGILFVNRVAMGKVSPGVSTTERGESQWDTIYGKQGMPYVSGGLKHDEWLVRDPKSIVPVQWVEVDLGY